MGRILTLTTFGESHGEAIGGIVDGCPAGITVDESFIQDQVDRRRPGQSKITTQRKESDTVRILSGIFEGKTTGTPIGFIIENEDQRSKDYAHIKDSYRPSHADFVFQEKYGHRDYRGGGRSSARVTAPIVVGGAIAQAFLAAKGVSLGAWVQRVHDIEMTQAASAVDLSEVEDTIVRCPEAAIAEQMISRIEEIKKSGDTVGGSIRCRIDEVPVGLGSPVFDKLHASLAKAMIGINAVKGVEFGSGIGGTYQKGSEQNDLFVSQGEEIRTATNNSGGIQGGISNGMPVVFTVHFKPVATIIRDQESVDREGNAVIVKGKGRHDPCVVPRAVPIVEGLAALVLADAMLLQRGDRV